MFKNKSQEEKKYLILMIGVVSFSFVFILLWAINLRQVFFPVGASEQSSQDSQYWQDLRGNVLGNIEEFSSEWEEISNTKTVVQGESVLDNLKEKIEQKNPCLLGEECE